MGMSDCRLLCCAPRTIYKCVVGLLLSSVSQLSTREKCTQLEKNVGLVYVCKTCRKRCKKEKKGREAREWKCGVNLYQFLLIVRCVFEKKTGERKLGVFGSGNSLFIKKTR
jgi:hypothetical protein